MQPMFHFHWDFEQICPLQYYLMDNQLKNLLKRMVFDVRHRRCLQFLFLSTLQRSQTSFFSYLKPFYDLVQGPNGTTHMIG